MSVVVTTPNSVVVGQPITVTATGLTSSGTAKVRITGPGDSKQIEVTLTASNGAIDMSNAAVVTPFKPGLYTVAVKDVSATTVTKTQVRVYGS